MFPVRCEQKLPRVLRFRTEGRRYCGGWTEGCCEVAAWGSVDCAVVSPIRRFFVHPPRASLPFASGIVIPFGDLGLLSTTCFP